MFLGRKVQYEELPNTNVRNKKYSFKRILKGNFMETLYSLQDVLDNILLYIMEGGKQNSIINQSNGKGEK